MIRQSWLRAGQDSDREGPSWSTDFVIQIVGAVDRVWTSIDARISASMCGGFP